MKLGVHQGLSKKAAGHEVLVGCNLALTKSLWLTIKDKLINDDDNIAEDIEMALVIFKNGGVVKFVPEMVAYTSARRMIKHPIKSLKTWNKKKNNINKT